jgi:hypothetical protein
MWMSFAMDGNRQEGKWLIAKCKALKWAKTNSAPPKIILTSPHGRWDDCDITFTIMMIIKTKETQMHKMHEQKGWIVWCPFVKVV